MKCRHSFSFALYVAFAEGRLLRLLLNRLTRKFKGETGTFADALALSGESATHFFRHPQPAVKAETMTVLACGKAVVENAREILGRNADAGIAHLDFYMTGGLVATHAQGQTFLR